VQVEHLSKYYHSHRALSDVNFSIEEGMIHGLLGPNGAGKSTLIKIICGLSSPGHGTIRIEGLPISEFQKRFPGQIGLLGERPPLYPNMRVIEYLEFVATIFRIDSSSIRSWIDEIIHELGIKEFLYQLNRNLSKGQAQRVGLAQALLPNPRLLVLDEPTSGLDPEMAMEFRHIIKKIRGKKTILFSGHILSEVEAIADDITILQKGTVIESGKLETLRHKFQTKAILEIVTTQLPQALVHEIQRTWDVEINVLRSNPNETKWRLKFKTAGDYRQPMAEFLIKHQLVALELKTIEPSLEEIFAGALGINTGKKTGNSEGVH